MNPDLKPSRRAWLTVALLCVVGGLNYLDRNMITTMHRSILGAVPMTEAQFGLLTSAFLWVYGLLSPAGGFLADRFGPCVAIIGSLFVWSAVTWLTGHAKTFEQLLVARAFMGVSEACYIPAALALIADYHRGPTRSRATSLHVMAIMAGTGFGGIGGWLADRYPWGLPFRLFGYAGMAYAVLLLFVLRPSNGALLGDGNVQAKTPPSDLRFFSAVGSLLRTPAFLFSLAGWSLLGVVGWMVVGWVPTFFQEKFHLSQGSAGFSATGLLSAAAFVGAFVGGALADRWQRTNPRGRILIPVAGLCIAAPAIFLMALQSVPIFAITALAVYGFTRIFVDANMMPMLCLVADARYRATGYGVLTLLSCFVGGVGIYAGGALRDADINLRWMFFFAAGCAVLAAIMFSLMRPKPVTNSSAAG